MAATAIVDPEPIPTNMHVAMHVMAIVLNPELKYEECSAMRVMTTGLREVSTR